MSPDLFFLATIVAAIPLAIGSAWLAEKLTPFLDHVTGRNRR